MALHSATDHARHVTEDPNPERFKLYRLCDCPICEGKGKATYPMQLARWEVEYGETVALSGKCPECRGEGRVRELVATAASPEAVGVALVTLGREGEWAECPIGLLDTEGAVGEKWLVRPWTPSARNVSDAGRTLAKSRKKAPPNE